ncbi:hypothetical protein [Sporomusa termitida]|uniref:DUF1269 domain-containing protein n=1 Tax=Sporomusa termitida TaxID=2377 RepID=A0A517DP94_9FIRM|nr:hypothetical protein [Sporomusa termitida]QDR79185.1 hypothetical protein SPTER_04530 [Sporomusa termitida]
MHIFAIFDHNLYIELAISDLEIRGIAREKILAVPLEKETREMAVLDTIHRADGVSLIDGGAVLGTILMLLGTIWGFHWYWGPIVGGLIGLALGVASGIGLDWVMTKRQNRPSNLSRKAEVVLVVHCTESEAGMVKKTLKDHCAIGVGLIHQG